MNGEKRMGAETDGPMTAMSRRGALGFLGVAGFAGLSSTTASAKQRKGNGNGGNGNGGGGNGASAEINVLPNPNFITNAAGEVPPFDPDVELFDPAPVSIPLDEIIEGSEEYDSTLGRSLNDGKHQVVRPPAGYDREEGYDGSWVPVTWGEYGAVGGTATVGGVKPDNGNGGNGNGNGGATGTRVNINVENALPNGQYTIWVVKFAALADDGDLGPSDPFVTPAGNGLVGFHNLGQKFGGDGDSENDFTVDENGDGGIRVFNEGGDLTGIPGFNEPGYPFVGEADDYGQSADRLSEIANDLREEDEIHFVGAFHYDDQVWGVYPGPWHVNQFSAVFQF
ncbi:hypothetical protein [Halorubrum sp. CGM4_25_10-8A]|uniref:hypothetical protein n=1 Tax=Halorubrum sp. CGM4_25_10-8A TaxID=2518116 RepID=UPI0010F8F91A|nr:hypothetical protein [Halorubrum sp. CGM4_25_10-8A]TKX39899.1 hypothetical protein EXE52_09735 [Halorubrum sp. CGM4_25_10-8A]